jgi:hypothetical protein
MYGLLHDPSTGADIRRQVRILKVGIGVPKGPDVHVWIDAAGKWTVEVGRTENRKRASNITRFDTRAEAQKFYAESRKTAEIRTYPAKFPYFTFLRMGISGDYVHDFDAIEQHGPIPNEIEIVLLTDAPLDAAYQWFTESRLNCEGDGCHARRRVEAATAEDRPLAEAAIAAGEKWFLLDRCHVDGCPFSKATEENGREKPPRCKPHGRLYFQLVNQPRIGGTATFDTTGFRSISQLHSCIQEIKMVTGNGDPTRGYIAGIPLTMVLRPYKVNHNGKASVQYGVSLEFRAQNAVEMRRLLVEHGQAYRSAITGSGEIVDVIPEDRHLAAPAPEDQDADAAAMTAEYYPDEEGPEDGEPEEGAEPGGIQMPRRKSDAAPEAK